MNYVNFKLMWHKILFIILKKVIFIICISSEDKKSFEMLFLHKKFIKKITLNDKNYNIL